MSSVHWMGEEIESLARDLGGDARRQIEDWVWHCKCRDRRPRYKTVLRLAIEYKRGVYLASEARDMLTCLLHGHSQTIPGEPDDGPDPQG